MARSSCNHLIFAEKHVVYLRISSDVRKINLEVEAKKITDKRIKNGENDFVINTVFIMEKKYRIKNNYEEKWVTVKDEAKKNIRKKCCVMEHCKRQINLFLDSGWTSKIPERYKNDFQEPFKSCGVHEMGGAQHHHGVFRCSCTEENSNGHKKSLELTKA